MSGTLDLEGQHALVTGGGTGLGLATAKALDCAGAEVTIAGRRGDVLERALQDLGPQPYTQIGICRPRRLAPIDPRIIPAREQTRRCE